eukprot:Skav222191  [mRNA]  locus=scaffold1745:38556:38915:- [translate_table: standard]
MLRYTVRWDLDFDEQWQEIKCLSRRRDLVLASWHRHLTLATTCWATVLRTPPLQMLYGGPDTPKSGDVEGVGVTVCVDQSYWSFLRGNETSSCGQDGRLENLVGKFHLRRSRIKVTFPA